MQRHRGRLEKALADTLGSGLRGIAGHEGDPRGVAAQVDRRQVGVGGGELDILELHPQHLGHNGSQDVVGALADVDGAAQ